MWGGWGRKQLILAYLFCLFWNIVGLCQCDNQELAVFITDASHGADRNIGLVCNWNAMKGLVERLLEQLQARIREDNVHRYACAGFVTNHCILGCL